MPRMNFLLETPPGWLFPPESLWVGIPTLLLLLLGLWAATQFGSHRPHSEGE